MGGKKKNALKGTEKATGQQNGRQKSVSGSKGPEKKEGTSSAVKAQSRSDGTRRKDKPQASKSTSSKKLWVFVLLLSATIPAVAIVAMNESAQATLVNGYQVHVHPYVLLAAEKLSIDVSALGAGLQKNDVDDEKPAFQKQDIPAPTPDDVPIQGETAASDNAHHQMDPTDMAPEKPVVQNILVKTSPNAEKETASDDTETKQTLNQPVSADPTRSEKEMDSTVKADSTAAKQKVESSSSTTKVDSPPSSQKLDSTTPAQKADTPVKAPKADSSTPRPQTHVDKADSLTPETKPESSKTPEGKPETPGEKTPEGKPETPGVKTPEGKPETTGKKTPEGKSETPGVKTPEGKSETPVIKKKDADEIQPPEASRDSYEKSSTTNDADYKVRKKLDKADDLLQKGKLDKAFVQFDAILRKHPDSPRGLAGKAETVFKMAEEKRSNQLLEQSIEVYGQLLTVPDVPVQLMKKSGRRLADWQQFRGWGQQARKTMQFLVDRYPDDIQLQRELGVSHMMVGQNADAKEVFQKILQQQPDDGFALVHLGFIYQTHDNDPEKAIPILQAGIESNAPGTQDGRFYFHLGSALQRQNRTEEARRLYVLGAERGLFLSADQRSLYNVDSLTGRPWWTEEQTGYKKYLKLLEDNWQVIRDEGLRQLNSDTGDFKPEEENLREKGDWKQLALYAQGRRKNKVCAKVPKTCELIDQIEPAKSCKRGQVKFSVMQPGVHVWPHCGPTNCRIRAHLGLVVPEGPKIRVANETRTWQEGKFIIFDDSFEHEVWHDGKSVRLVLIVDFWHPELTESQRRTLTPI